MNANAHQQFLLHKELQHALERGAGPALPAQILCPQRPGGRRRGPAALAAPGAWCRLAGQLPAAGGEEQAHHPHRQLGHRRGVPPDERLAGGGSSRLGAWRSISPPSSLASPGLLEEVQGALARHRLEARHLTLEITESTAMQKAEESLAILNRLAELGLGISIDDFGTGYSSLLYLKRFPANELKIDRGFVTTLERGGDDATIIAAIIALGQALEMRIVAEGWKPRSSGTC